MRTPPSLVLLIVVATAAVIGAQSQEGFRFKSGVEFVNVTATVTDGNGRFVSGLRQEAIRPAMGQGAATREPELRGAGHRSA